MSTLTLCNFSHFILAQANHNQPFTLYHSTEPALVKMTKELHVPKPNAQISAFLPPGLLKTFEYFDSSQIFRILCSLSFHKSSFSSFSSQLTGCSSSVPIAGSFISYHLWGLRWSRAQAFACFFSVHMHPFVISLGLLDLNITHVPIIPIYNSTPYLSPELQTCIFTPSLISVTFSKPNPILPPNPTLFTPFPGPVYDNSILPVSQNSNNKEVILDSSLFHHITKVTENAIGCCSPFQNLDYFPIFTGTPLAQATWFYPAFLQKPPKNLSASSLANWDSILEATDLKHHPCVQNTAITTTWPTQS